MKGFRRAHLPFSGCCWRSFSFPLFAAAAERVEDLPQPTDYVSDFAHVLSPEAIARLDRSARNWTTPQANAQIAVVTCRPGRRRRGRLRQPA
jgi:uncharacterized membrane protein YgcG